MTGHIDNRKGIRWDPLGTGGKVLGGMRQTREGVIKTASREGKLYAYKSLEYYSSQGRVGKGLQTS